MYRAALSVLVRARFVLQRQLDEGEGDVRLLWPVKPITDDECGVILRFFFCVIALAVDSKRTNEDKPRDEAPLVLLDSCHQIVAFAYGRTWCRTEYANPPPRHFFPRIRFPKTPTHFPQSGPWFQAPSHFYDQPVKNTRRPTPVHFRWCSPHATIILIKSIVTVVRGLRAQITMPFTGSSSLGRMMLDSNFL